MTDLIALSRRWKACKNFRWMKGMRVINAGIIGWVNRKSDGGRAFFSKGGAIVPIEALPDLSDPATVGLLEHQVLGLYGGDQFSVRSTNILKKSVGEAFWWRVKDLRGASLASGSVVLVGTDHAKIACLVDALERYEEEP